MTKILISLLFTSLLCAAQAHFSLTLSKQKVYVGEPLTIALTLENNSSEKITKVTVSPLKLEGYKILPVPEKETDKRHRKYILLPQVPGTHTLPAQSIEFARKDPSTYRNIWQTLKTLPTVLSVIPLPAGIQTTGNYRLKSSIDHHSVLANRPLNLTIMIEGIGSLKTMKQWHLNLKDVLVFEGEPKIHSKIVKGIYKSTFTQTFSIISDKDFRLPPLQWHYLNTDTGLAETLSTPSYQIQVKRPPQKSYLLKYIGLVLVGLMIGILLTLLIFALRARGKPSDIDLAKSIRKATSDKKLYRLLLPYADNDAIAEVLRLLEENVHQKSMHPIDRAEILKLLKGTSNNR